MDNIHEKEIAVNNILTRKQLNYILDKIAQTGSQIVDYQIKKASEQGLVGFLGEHMRMLIFVKENNLVREIHLFIKAVPVANKPKADLINGNDFFKREALVYNLIEEIHGLNSKKPWSTKALLYKDDLLVLPDLSVQGYQSHPLEKYLDKEHVLVTLSSLARFHAAFSNHLTEKGPSYNFLNEYGHIVKESFFRDSPWLRAAAKLTNNFLSEFSSKYKQYPMDLEEKIMRQFLKACKILEEAEGTLNVLLHKDLWLNNILFRYQEDLPDNAVFIDFQVIRFASPAFDVMSFLYLTTDRNFRDIYEKEVLYYYFSTFMDNLSELTKIRARNLNYDREAFFNWCTKARLFGITQAITLFPFTLMDPISAQSTFNNPDTYVEYVEIDRTEPVVAYARKNMHYKTRQLEVCEEFVKRYIL